MMQGLYRLRFEYAKDERLAYLGHLEVINTMLRCIRRAQLPFSVGNGFARRVRIQFSQALPVGASSSSEYFDLVLTERMGEQDALSALAASTPPALAPRRCGYVDGSLPALEAWLTRSRWKLEVLGSNNAEALLEGAKELKKQGQLVYLRGDKEKRVDLTSTLVSLDAKASPDGESILATMETRSSPEGSLRPLVLISAIATAHPDELSGIDSVRVRRVGQWHETEDGRLVEPL